jgi:hypothetical protein
MRRLGAGMAAMLAEPKVIQLLWRNVRKVSVGLPSSLLI